MPRRQGKVERYQFTGAGHLIRNLTRSMADRRIHHDDRRIHHPRLAPSGAWHRLASGTVWRLAPSGRSALHLRLARTSDAGPRFGLHVSGHQRLEHGRPGYCTAHAVHRFHRPRDRCPVALHLRSPSRLIRPSKLEVPHEQHHTPFPNARFGGFCGR
jgi:hypothetical protein